MCILTGIRGEGSPPTGGSGRVAGKLFEARGEFVQNTFIFPVSRTIDGTGAVKSRKLAAGSGPDFVDQAS
jgi:hypothetical protein